MKRCCPVNEANQECNGRGNCVAIFNNDPWDRYCANLSNESLRTNKYCKTLNFLRRRPDINKPDFRYNWPAQIFTHICKCTGNWAGYDCSRCKRGYSGTNCADNQTVVRRSFLDLSPSEKNRFIEILNMSKYLESDFTIPLHETPTGTDSFKSLSLYDVFATFHYYTIRDEALKVKTKNNESFHMRYSIPDFAHEGSGFLSWHRAYLLYFETELQHMLNDSSFALPYWDWTAYTKLKDMNNTECPDILSRELFGQNDIDCYEPDPQDPQKAKYENGLAILTDKFKWRPICTNYEHLTNEGELCDPYENDNIGAIAEKIIRCAGSMLGDLQSRAKGELPTVSDVKRVLCEQPYDVYSYDDNPTTRGFRNALEGFYNFKNKEENFAEMHNKVHLYIGGLMMHVATSSNDPIFWLHHCNIDRLYEKWFEKYGDETLYIPNKNSVEYAVGFGHNGFDNAGLLFPPITNDEAHQCASEFGYSYQDPISCTIDVTPSLTSCPTATISPTPTGTMSTTSNPGDSNQTPGGNNQTPGGNNQSPGGTNQNSSGVKGSLHPSYMVNTP